MNIYDCHLHSRLSFDSVEDMENYVRIAAASGDERFITTEHTDLESNFSPSHEDIVPDFERQMCLMEELAGRYPIDMLMGIEVGWRKDIHRRNCRLVKKYPFDFVILSVHESDDTDVSFPEFRQEKTVDECYNEYLKLVYSAVSAFDDFDTLGHIDYLLRYAGDTDMERHRAMLEKIFSVLIEKGKALELNTKLFPDRRAVRRMEYAARLFVSMGGRYFTIGSDAHRTAYYKNGFSDGLRLLKERGAGGILLFKGRKPDIVRL